MATPPKPKAAAAAKPKAAAAKPPPSEPEAVAAGPTPPVPETAPAGAQPASPPPPRGARVACRVLAGHTLDDGTTRHGPGALVTLSPETAAALCARCVVCLVEDESP